MTFFSRLPAKVVLLIVVAAIAAGVASAALRRTAATIGTGVVVIKTNLAYENAEAAGTGMVLTSSGEVLTNNHVIAGATSIRVVVPGTDRTYAGTVVGYSRTKDVAVVQLKNASNLKTISVGSSASVGESVTALGNAGGTGKLTRVTGAVTALGQRIVASDDQGSSEQLTGLIRTNAPVVAGDSGGPLLDASGRVIAMDTAASTGFSFRVSQSSVAYAIPIRTALSIAKQIESGSSSSTVHVGPTAFLGVALTSAQDAAFGFGQYGQGVSGVEIAGVVSGGPADRAGLQQGDVITAVNGKAVSSSDEITKLVLAKKPGTKLRLAYSDGFGDSGAATVTLGTGPAQ
jgi:S1-C subfamily serine protease